jgi:hypothetical protein
LPCRRDWIRWHGPTIDELDRLLALTDGQFLEEQLEVLVARGSPTALKATAPCSAIEEPSKAL